MFAHTNTSLAETTIFSSVNAGMTMFTNASLFSKQVMTVIPLLELRWAFNMHKLAANSVYLRWHVFPRLCQHVKETLRETHNL